MSEKSVAIVGATGAVGTEILNVLEARAFPISNLRLLASERSRGKQLPFAGEEISVEVLGHDSFKGVELAIFSAGASRSKEFAPSAVKAGAVVVDNSSAFRYDDDVPLVIPEINAADIRNHKGIIANPNCTTAVVLMGVWPVYSKCSHVKRMIAASYQAASGAGAAAMRELVDQTRACLEERPFEPKALPKQIAFNVIPHIDAFQDNAFTKEEMKLTWESRKIMHAPELAVSCTCVRVPVLRAHSIAVWLELERSVSVEEARAAIDSSPGVQLMDDTANFVYPMPIDASGKYDCFVGRLRKDTAFENGLSMWVVGDQLLKGAALNAVQIAELV